MNKLETRHARPRISVRSPDTSPQHSTLPGPPGGPDPWVGATHGAGQQRAQLHRRVPLDRATFAHTNAIDAAEPQRPAAERRFESQGDPQLLVANHHVRHRRASIRQQREGVSGERLEATYLRVVAINGWNNTTSGSTQPGTKNAQNPSARRPGRASLRRTRPRHRSRQDRGASASVRHFRTEQPTERAQRRSSNRRRGRIRLRGRAPTGPGCRSRRGSVRRRSRCRAPRCRPRTARGRGRS